MQHGDAAMEAITHGTKSLFTLCKPDNLFCSLFFQLCTYIFMGIHSHTLKAPWLQPLLFTLIFQEYIWFFLFPEIKHLCEAYNYPPACKILQLNAWKFIRLFSFSNVDNVGVKVETFQRWMNKRQLIESAYSHNAQNHFESSTAQIWQKSVSRNIARSNTLNILYSEYLMAIHKAHNGFHRTITISFVLFAFSPAMCSQFPAAMKKKYIFYIDWAGLFNSIVAYPDLGGWGAVKIILKSMGGSKQDKNNWLLSNSCRQQNN